MCIRIARRARAVDLPVHVLLTIQELQAQSCIACECKANRDLLLSLYLAAELAAEAHRLSSVCHAVSRT